MPLANLMRAHAKPGDMVVFQDLGQTPWAAMDLRFVDPLGLVDSTIGKIRWRDRASPFLRMPSERGQMEIRDHLFDVKPQAHRLRRLRRRRVRRRGHARRPTRPRRAREKETLFAPFLTRNPYYCGLYDDRASRALPLRRHHPPQGQLLVRSLRACLDSPSEVDHAARRRDGARLHLSRRTRARR